MHHTAAMGRSQQLLRPPDTLTEKDPERHSVHIEAFLPEQSLTYAQRIARLRETKLAHTRQKQQTRGPMDSDDQGMVPLPPDAADVIEAMSGSGVLVRESVLKGVRMEANHPSGGFFGPLAVGMNFRRLLNAHPTYIQPNSSMAGVYMTSFNAYRKPGWNPDYDYSHLQPDLTRYGIDSGIGGMQHFCPDLSIGLELGWEGLREKVLCHREKNPGREDFYDGLEHIITGMQD